MAYSEPQLGTSLLTFPIVFFGGNTVLVYNLALLFFFFGAGMAVYALCWWILGWIRELPQADRCIASITAGILYAFTPYMFREIGVLQLLATAFPPLCLLGLHRFFHQKRLFDMLLFFSQFSRMLVYMCPLRIIFKYLCCWLYNPFLASRLITLVELASWVSTCGNFDRRTSTSSGWNAICKSCLVV